VKSNNTAIFLRSYLGDPAFMAGFLQTLSKYLGENVCELIAYLMGRHLGSRIYKLFMKSGDKRLEDAGNFLIGALRELRLAKDVAIFASKPKASSELVVFVRVATSSQVYEKVDSLFHILRGVLFQYYHMLTLGVVRVSGLNLSNSLRARYEYSLRISTAAEWSKGLKSEKRA